MKRAFIIAAVLSAVLAGCGGGTSPDNGAVVLLQGSHSAGKQQQALDIHDQAAFKDMWDKAFAGDSSPPKMPDVDFTKYVVVAFFLGEMKHGGFVIRVDKAAPSDTPGTYDVDWLVISPGANCVHTTEEVSHPFLIATVPAAGQSISFDVKNRAEAQCG